MATDSSVLVALRQAFSAVPRPDHFTNVTHCEECAEHDELLRSRSLDTLAHADVSNHGWDPFCFVSPAGFAYYLPALARIAMAPDDFDNGRLWYGPMLFTHLISDGPGNARVQYCTPTQRSAVVQFLRYILSNRSTYIDPELHPAELEKAIEIWGETASVA